MIMLYQQVVFMRERMLALKMAIIHDVEDVNAGSLCLLNAHYLDSDGQLWLFISNALQYVEAFARPRHIKLDFFSPEKNFHVESVGITSAISPEDRDQALAYRSPGSTFVVKVDISHMEYYEHKTRKAREGVLSMLYYKWLNFIDRNGAGRLLVLRKS
jgi:hypothetical protein